MDEDKQQYKCPNCGWIGTVNQMIADEIGSGGDEIWCNTICPKCEYWQKLSDYEILQPA